MIQFQFEKKYIDGGLGNQTRGSRIEGAGEPHRAAKLKFKLATFNLICTKKCSRFKNHFSFSSFTLIVRCEK